MKTLLVVFACIGVLLAGTPVSIAFAGPPEFHEGLRCTSPDDFRERATAPNACKGQNSKDKTARKILERTIESLMARAERQGSVKIILGLCVDFVPEGQLASQREIQTQRRSIAHAQAQLLKKLALHKITAIKKYEFMPFIAMQVGPAALKLLKSSSLVASVEEDLPMAPMS